MPLISFSGHQSTGKSTATMQLAADLKKTGKSVGLWTDLPRECPLGTNEFNTAASQFWIAGSMLSRTETLLSIYDYVVTDRTLFDTVLYEIAARGPSSVSDALFALARVFAIEHNQRILWVTHGYDHVYEKGRTKDTVFNASCIEASKYVLDMLLNTSICVEEIDIRDVGSLSI